jgi:hypothetical protein
VQGCFVLTELHFTWAVEPDILIVCELAALADRLYPCCAHAIEGNIPSIYFDSILPFRRRLSFLTGSGKFLVMFIVWISAAQQHLEHNSLAAGRVVNGSILLFQVF